MSLPRGYHYPNLSAAQLAQRKLAAKSSYRAWIRRILDENRRSDGTVDYDQAALRLSCIRLNHSTRRGGRFKHTRGITSDYMRKWDKELQDENKDNAN